jgi:hypothetical protein
MSIPCQNCGLTVTSGYQCVCGWFTPINPAMRRAEDEIADLRAKLAKETKRADDNFLAAARHGDDFLMAHGKARRLKDERDALESKLAEAVSLLRPLIGEYGFCMYEETPVHHENCRAFLARIAAETEAK